MKKVGIFEGKTQFSALIDDAERGGTTIITKRGKPVAKISSAIVRKPSDAFGMDEGLVVIAEDFDETPDDFKDYA